MIWLLRNLKPVSNLYGECITDVVHGARNVSFTLHHLSVELYVLITPRSGQPYITNELPLVRMGTHVLLQRGAQYTIDKLTGTIRSYTDESLAGQYLGCAASSDDSFATICENVHAQMSNGLNRVALEAKKRGQTVLSPVSGGIDSTLATALLVQRGHTVIPYTFGWRKGDETADQLAAYENAKGIGVMSDLEVLDLSDKKLVDFAQQILPRFSQLVPIALPRKLWLTVFLRYLSAEWIKHKYNLPPETCSITGDSGGSFLKLLLMTKPKRIKYTMWDQYTDDPDVKDRMAQLQHVARIHTVTGTSAYATTELTWETLTRKDMTSYYSPFHDREFIAYAMTLKSRNVYQEPLEHCGKGKHTLRAILRDVAPNSLWSGEKLAFENIFSKWDARGISNRSPAVQIARLADDKYQTIRYVD